MVTASYSVRDAFQRILLMLWHLPTGVLEIYLGVQALGFGLMLLAPAQTFLTSPSFAAMAHIAPEEYWGSFAIGIGLFILISVLYAIQPLRRISFFVAAVFWVFVATQIASVTLFTPGVTTYGGIAIASIYVYIRIDSHGRV